MRIFQFIPNDTPFVPYVNMVRRGCLEHIVVHAAAYGHALRQAWRSCDPADDGLICLEHDIAMPQEAWLELAAAQAVEPEDVIAVPYILYPESTGLDSRVWAHRVRYSAGALQFVTANVACPEWPQAVGLGCTYLPAALLNAMPEDLAQWCYPRLDTLLSELAGSMCLTLRCTQRGAVHLHY